MWKSPSRWGATRATKPVTLAPRFSKVLISASCARVYARGGRGSAKRSAIVIGDRVAGSSVRVFIAARGRGSARRRDNVGGVGCPDAPEPQDQQPQDESRGQGSPDGRALTEHDR